MIINLTQHSATPDQIKVGVVDLPPADQQMLRHLLTFECIPDNRDIKERAREIAELAASHAPPKPDFFWAMIGGAPWLMSALERELTAREITPVYSFTRRENVEETLPDGTVRKVSKFRHGGFVEAVY